MKLDHNQWFYHKDKEPRLFLEGEILPDGWVDTPAKFDQEEEEPKKIDEMTKKELESYAKAFGIDLDRRKSKANMLKDFEDELNDSPEFD